MLQIHKIDAFRSGNLMLYHRNISEMTDKGEQKHEN